MIEVKLLIALVKILVRNKL